MSPCKKWDCHDHRLMAVIFSGVILAPSLANAIEIEEIVVTAQKRAESAQDVPISISAYSGKGLEELGIHNLTDVGKFTSGVEMLNSDLSQPTHSIRGIQTFDFTAGSDPTVAVYVDGVYSTRSAGSEIPLTDIERVEILKGPQGTLFGRNAIGGAIHIITQTPGPEQTGSIKVRAGNYDRRDVELFYNQPLTDELAVRISGYAHRRDGWLDNVAGDDQNQEDNQGGRFSLAWHPSDSYQMIWRADYHEHDQVSGIIPTDTDAIVQFGNPPLARADVFGQVAIDGFNGEERESFNTSLEVVKDYEDFTLTSITAYRQFNTDFWQDEDGSANPDYVFNSLNETDDDQISQEFRLNGETKNLKWTLGATYNKEHIDRLTLAQFAYTTLETFAGWEAIKAGLIPGIPGVSFQTESQLAELLPYVRLQNKLTQQDGIFLANFIAGLIKPCGVQVPDDLCAQNILPGVQLELTNSAPWNETVRNTGTYQSTAIYGDTTWSLTDKLDLSVGARYTKDDKTFTINTQYQNTFLGIPFGLAFFNNGQPSLDTHLDDDWEALSGRLVLDYQFEEDVMGYASISSGFKSGGYNSLNFGPGVEPTYDAEDMTNYEIGMKADFLENRLRVNAATYFYVYNELQELDLIGVPIPSYNLRNADAEGSGLDLDIIYAPTDNLMVAGNYSYLDTEYTEYQIIEAVGETPADSKVGQPRAGTPRNKLNLSLIYTLSLNDMGVVDLRVDYFYTGERLTARTDVSEADPARMVDSYDQWNARATYTTPNDRWILAIWGQNLTDEEDIGDFGNIGQAIGSVAAWPLPPRMYGMDIIYNF